MIKIHTNKNSYPHTIFGGNVSFEITSNQLTVYVGNEVKQFKCENYSKSEDCTILDVYENWKY